MGKGGITKSISIPQADVFGMVGTGLGHGLAEQIPKEIDRYRLASGLNELGQDKNLTPFQQFARLSSIPGITPQMIQSGGELLRQQGIAQGFRGVRDQSENASANPLRQAVSNEKTQEQIPQQTPGLKPNTPGLVTPQTTKATLENYIPKNREQLLSRAADLYDQNPQLYPNPESALQAAAQEDQQNQAINQAQQQGRDRQIGVEDRLRGQLQGLRDKANAHIPDNIYQQVENDMIEKVASGMPELQAAKESQKKLDEISRDYKGLETVGNWVLPFRSANESKRSLFSLRDKFKERNDLENFADSLVAKNGLSYPKAYYLAYPVSEQKNLNELVKKLPNLATDKMHYPVYDRNYLAQQTKKIIPELAKQMGKEGSPLSIGEELRKKGYDTDAWFDYLTKNKRALDLTERQARELDKPKNWFPSLNDLWLFTGTGMSNVIED